MIIKDIYHGFFIYSSYRRSLRGALDKHMRAFKNEKDAIVYSKTIPENLDRFVYKCPYNKSKN